MHTANSENENRPERIDGRARTFAITDHNAIPGPGPSPERFEPLLNSAAAAKLLQIHPKTLQKLARLGRVPAHNICGFWRFRASELDDWLKTTVSSKSHSRSN
jgi:excisionase family DNA binding protein